MTAHAHAADATRPGPATVPGAAGRSGRTASDATARAGGDPKTKTAGDPMATSAIAVTADDPTTTAPAGRVVTTSAAAERFGGALMTADGLTGPAAAKAANDPTRAVAGRLAGGVRVEGGVMTTTVGATGGVPRQRQNGGVR